MRTNLPKISPRRPTNSANSIGAPSRVATLHGLGKNLLGHFSQWCRSPRSEQNAGILRFAQNDNSFLGYSNSRNALALILCLLFASPNARAQPAPRELHVLAADDLQPVLPALAEAYTHATGIKLLIRYGPSATLAAQIAPYAPTAPAAPTEPVDLFLSTDYVFPEQVVAANLADTSAPIPYARGTLVLWARADSSLQPLTQNTLSSGRFTSLAIADPAHAPYGRAAVAVLTRMKLYDQFKPRLILAEDPAQLVESGKAQLALLSLTAASTPHNKQIGSFILMPPSTYLEIRQCAIVLRNSSNSAAAHAFLDWLRSPPIQQTLTAYGLAPLQ